LAVWEAYFGAVRQARNDAEAALKLTANRNIGESVALALAFAGDLQRAQIIADGLGETDAANTLVQHYWTPTIQAILELHREKPRLAVDRLRETRPFELGSLGNLYPIYARGLAYLALHDGDAAIAEFQKIVDHPGIAWADPLVPLARLGLCRAYAIQDDSAKAQTAYENFFESWKDADPDIPILQQAKAEYAKLQ
jgi:hypothetical protein